MGVVSGPMTVARFRVVGELPSGWRETFRDRLTEFAFREPPQGMGKEEVEGWVQVHNLLDSDFSDFNRWLYDDVVIIGLRGGQETPAGQAVPGHLRATLRGVVR